MALIEASDGYIYTGGEGSVLKSSEPINPQPEWHTPFSVVNAKYKGPSGIANYFLLLCVPAEAVVVLKRLRRIK